eukprot:2914918-Rhodomonas_salina.1
MQKMRWLFPHDSPVWVYAGRIRCITLTKRTAFVDSEKKRNTASVDSEEKKTHNLGAVSEVTCCFLCPCLVAQGQEWLVADLLERMKQVWETEVNKVATQPAFLLLDVPS